MYKYIIFILIFTINSIVIKYDLKAIILDRINSYNQVIF